MTNDLSSEEEMISSANEREIIKADLLAFPESAAMNALELDEAVDRVITQSTPETAPPIAPGMRRLSDDDIAAFFAQATEIPTVADLGPGGLFPPGWLEQRRRQLDEEVLQPGKRMFVHEIGVLLAKIRVDLLTKGYVDVPKKLYLEDTPDLMAAYMEDMSLNPQEHMDYAGAFACPNDEDWWTGDAVLKKFDLTSLISKEELALLGDSPGPTLYMI
jgi:hypothetical protein